MKKITYLAWLLLPTSLLVWAAVGLFAWTIVGDEADRALYVQTVKEEENKEAAATRLRAIVQDTAPRRAQLDAILRVDVVSIVDMLEAAGKAAGVSISVSSAIPESAPSSQAAGVSATGFVIEVQGRFSALMHVVQLFETLPIPSTLGRLDMERVGSSDTWHMSAYVRVLTISDTSS